MIRLIPDKTIQSNLKRTANEGFISFLDNNMMHDLAYKYFGVYENGKIIGYQCPYSGKIYSNSQDIILEHIIPVKSGGGTVLFNCIPASLEVNSTKEKGAKHLIEWWISSKYWDIDAPKRLEKLVNYILDGYENVFNTFSLDELEDTYLDYIDEDSYSYDEDLDLKKDDLISEKQARQNHINSYQGFLNDCIEQLRKSKIDVSYIENRLNTIQNKKHIFEDIERFKQFQNIIKKLIIEYIGDDNRFYLTYALNINTKKLMDSIKNESSEQIYFELKQRLNNIMDICKQNGVSFNDYLKNLRDIEEINILYLEKNQIEENLRTIFINNIKIGLDTKIDIFIEMIAQEKYTGYKNGKTDNSNVFSYVNEIPFEGYENIEGLNTKFMWFSHSLKIIERIKKLKEIAKTEEEIIKYEKAEKAIENYTFKTQLEKRIDKFIEMLSQEKYTGYTNGEPNNNNIFTRSNEIPFEGYEDIEGLSTKFMWFSYSVRIIERIKKLKEIVKKEEEIIKYEKAEKAIENYSFSLQSELEKRIDKFIEMIAQEKYTGYINGEFNDNNVFKSKNEISFEGYESIEGLNTSQFWSHNSLKIIERIKKLKEIAKTEEEIIKYEKAEKAIENYSFKTQLEKRIDKFIEMIAQEKYTGYIKGEPNDFNIFNQSNEIPFEGYESIEGLNTRQFWNRHSFIIIERIKKLKEIAKTEEEIIKYEKAEKAIENYSFKTQLDKRIDKFIEMIVQEKYTEYDGKRIDRNNVFGYYNEIPFEGYESIEGLNTSHFWNRNSYKIIEKLFYGEYKNKIEYNKAREAVLTYLKVNTIEEYIDKLDKSKAKNKVLVELRNSQLKEIEKLTSENQLLSSNLYAEEQKGKVV